jgi:ATP-dependent RNA helicase RhlE
MVVLDEVDRMLDMGFINDVRHILSELPAIHQAFFFSATLSPEIRSLIDTFTTDPVVINVKVGDTSQNVHQDVIYFSGKTQKMDFLHDLLLSEGVDKALIFGKTKYGVERLAKELKARGFKVDALHGGKNQGQRGRALDAFRENKINILVATDVAARGIDVKDISHVINYDTPQTYDDYIHRIGRAGRAGQAGHALTFSEKP